MNWRAVLIAYSAAEAQQILGLHLNEIEAHLGYIRTKALIHANDFGPALGIKI